MNANEKCVVKNFKDANAVYQNVEWLELQSALLYYRYFGEERLAEDLEESLETSFDNDANKKAFTKLVKEIKGGGSV